METSIRVFLVHSNEVIREGVRHILHSYQGIEIVGEALNVESSLAQVVHLAPDVLVIEPKTAAITRVEVIPEFTLTISRDSEGRPLVNMTAYKDTAPLGEMTIVGRQGEHRVQVIDVDAGGYRVLEHKGEELAKAIMLAAGEDLRLDMTSGDIYRTLIGHESVALGNGHASNGHQNGLGNGKVDTGHVQTKRVVGNWFGHVTNGATPLVETIEKSDTEEETTGDAKMPLGEHPPEVPQESREVQENSEVKAEQAIWPQDNDESWLQIWQEPTADDPAWKETKVEVEMIFPPNIKANDLYTFITRLRLATKAEVNRTTGSSTGTSVLVDFAQSMPLLKILRAMPEVIEVEPVLNTDVPLWGAIELPRSVRVVLMPSGDPSQLSLWPRV